MAPEYALSGQLSEESEVYSSGVDLLELITGRKPVDVSPASGRRESLVEWVMNWPLAYPINYTEISWSIWNPDLMGAVRLLTSIPTTAKKQLMKKYKYIEKTNASMYHLGV